MSECEHTWERWTDIPPYTARLYFVCTLCGIIGVQPHNGSTLTNTSRRRHVKPIRCVMLGCKDPATARNRGLSAGRLQWVCQAHVRSA